MLTIKKKAKITKQTQEQQIATITNKVASALSVYKKQLVIAGFVLVALIVIAGGYSLMRSADERKASPLLATAYEAYSPLAATTDYGKALELFRGVQKKYPGTMSGAIAQYYVGNSLVALGRADEALKEYEFFIKKYSGEKALLGLVYQRMAYVYSTLGKQAEAIKAFEQAEAVGGPGVATIELARIYESSGNMAEAQKKYKVAQEKLGGTTWGIEAMGKVQVIKPGAQPAAGSAEK